MNSDESSLISCLVFTVDPMSLKGSATLTLMFGPQGVLTAEQYWSVLEHVQLSNFL